MNAMLGRLCLQPRQIHEEIISRYLAPVIAIDFAERLELALANLSGLTGLDTSVVASADNADLGQTVV